MIAGGVVGAVLTFLLQKQGLSPVFSSSLIGIIVASIGFFLPQPFSVYIPAVVFAGTFVGMTALSLANVPIMIFAGALAGLLYALFYSVIFPGYGGRLGVVAFIATLVVIVSTPYVLKILQIKF